MKQKGQSRIKNIHIDYKIAKIWLHTTQPKQIVVLREKSKLEITRHYFSVCSEEL